MACLRFAGGTWEVFISWRPGFLDSYHSHHQLCVAKPPKQRVALGRAPRYISNGATVASDQRTVDQLSLVAAGN